MARNTHCKICHWQRTCKRCRKAQRQGAAFARSFDRSSLTIVPYEEWRSLPEVSAIYFAIDMAGGAVYIGQTQNLLYRWRGNYRALYHYGVSRIGFVEVPDSGLWRLSAERVLIERVQPSMNGVRKIMGPTKAELSRAMN